MSEVQSFFVTSCDCSWFMIQLNQSSRRKLSCLDGSEHLSFNRVNSSRSYNSVRYHITSRHSTWHHYYNTAKAEQHMPWPVVTLSLWLPSPYGQRCNLILPCNRPYEVKTHHITSRSRVCPQKTCFGAPRTAASYYQAELVTIKSFLQNIYFPKTLSLKATTPMNLTWNCAMSLGQSTCVLSAFAFLALD